MRKRHGHYCRICGRRRPNEQFNGKGRRQHVCKRCQKRPRTERQAIEQEEEICGFLRQSHISERNVQRLKVLATSDNAPIANLAALVLRVAELTPYKRRRIVRLHELDPELLRQLEFKGMIDVW